MPKSDEEYKAYTLRISTKSGNTGIEQIIIEENKPGHYNSVKHEAVWDGKVPPRDATIKIVPTDKHATITNVVRVKSADSDASIFEPIKQPVENNTNRGTIEFVLKDGVKIAPDYYEYYRITLHRITVAQHKIISFVYKV